MRRSVYALLAASISVLVALQCAITPTNDLPESRLLGEFQKLGIVYRLDVRKDPRPLRLHIVRVDLRHPDIELTCGVGEDPDGEGPADAMLTPPPELARAARALVLVNCHAFRSVEAEAGSWHEGMPVDISGLAVADGRMRSRDETNVPAFWMDSAGVPRIGHPPKDEEVSFAVAGFYEVLRNGKSLFRAADTVRHPRTIMGLDREKRYLYLVVADGRQSGVSEGLSNSEMAVLMRELGCWQALNLDGGGSSVLLLANGDGQFLVANRPSTIVGGVSMMRPLPSALVVRRRR